MKTAKTKIFTLTTTVGLLALISACSGTPSDQNSSNTASPEASASASASGSASPSASPTSYRPASSDPNAKTSEGEPVAEAEKRFVTYATGTVKTKKSTDEILETGYKMCSFFKDEGTISGVIQRISDDSKNVEEESENLQLSGAAVKTLCPEYKDVS